MKVKDRRFAKFGERLDEKMEVLLTTAEADQVYKLAIKTGFSVSRLIRQMIFGITAPIKLKEEK